MVCVGVVWVWCVGVGVVCGCGVWVCGCVGVVCVGVVCVGVCVVISAPCALGLVRVVDGDCFGSTGHAVVLLVVGGAV